MKKQFKLQVSLHEGGMSMCWWQCMISEYPTEDQKSQIRRALHGAFESIDIVTVACCFDGKKPSNYCRFAWMEKLSAQEKALTSSVYFEAIQRAVKEAIG